ncbi:hypothetical protein MNBD_PLANCTO02-3257 [hydrothermal vent metagenome]|uniref:Uncharacterized protein n=1 Tax=hydrothermal vent metagenome TaxID=652676 RepID=A0A3B1DIN0_9ZZZZ
MENEGLFKNTMMVKDQVYSVPLFLTVTDSHGMKKTVLVEQDWMIRNGRWEIVDRDK